MKIPRQRLRQVLIYLDPRALLMVTTTWLFWSGVTLQHRTASDLAASPMKRFFSFESSKIQAKFRPSTTTTRFLSRSISLSRPNKEVKKLLWVAFSVCCPSSCLNRSFRLLWAMNTTLSCFLIRLQDRPISVAVCSLSPVKIQTASPALRNDSMASGTPSCSRSSIAVIPRYSNSFSILL